MGATEEFTPKPDDPLAPEHAALSRWVREAMESLGANQWWKDVDLKTVESGRCLLDSTPEQARKLVLAAVAQVQYWDEQMARIRASAQTDMARANPHLNPAWVRLSAPCRQTVTAISALLRRSLPLEKSDLLNLMTWCLGVERLRSGHAPFAYLVKALERYAGANRIDSELRDVMRQLAVRLRRLFAKELNRLGTQVEQLCAEGTSDSAPEPPAVAASPPPRPSPAGRPLVLYHLKHQFGIATDDGDASLIQIGPDCCNLPADSPLLGEHEQLTELIAEVARSQRYLDPNLRGFPKGLALLALDPLPLGRMFLAAAERHMGALLFPRYDVNDTQHWRAQYAAGGIARVLSGSTVQFDRDGLFDFLLYLSTRPAHERLDLDKVLFASIESEIENGAALSEGERFVLHLWRASRIGGPPLGVSSPEVEQLTRWIGDRSQFCLVPGEWWSDAVNADIARVPGAPRSQWTSLFKHLLTATSSRPSDKWRKSAANLVECLGADQVRQALERWLPLVSKGRTISRTATFQGDTRGAGDTIHEENATALRGLLWMVPSMPHREDLSRLVGSVAISAYKKIPGVGPRAVKVGNAAVYALSEMVSPEAIGQLATLKVRVRFGTAQKEIEKAFDAAAGALDLPRDQIEEMSVPSCGLENVGRREEVLGDYRAEMSVTGSDAAVKWFDARGKLLKAAPASVKKQNTETLKDLQQGLKDCKAMLSAQRDRIDALFLERKTWPEPVWRERYLDHPLVGTIARRLIWCTGGTPVTVWEGQALDIQGRTCETSDDTEVALWHPVGRSIDEVVAWRRRIEALGIIQPFKQAHREVYLLTDAERRTSTYSNRFAAHILRQHQFNALCGARRWKNKLRLMVDDSYPPASRELPAWGLRAEFWIEGVGTDYGVDTNDAGTYLRLASDQVRFYRMGAATNYAHAGGGGFATRAAGPGLDDVNEPMRLEDVPPLVFSEILRDVDLFVGVGSIGNDPTWQDGGPRGQYRDYWNTYSFGELSATAVTRRETLQRLIPRLKIAGRCSLADPFLIVRGNRRTYKIHLGSGNILMEPNDQYLCIVPDSSARANEAQVYLPFEGDLTLSIILSKAFLLVADATIKDATINRQIDGR